MGDRRRAYCRKIKKNAKAEGIPLAFLRSHTYADFLFKAGLVKENTAKLTAIMTIKPPHQAVAVTEPVCPITPPPMADPSAMPICKADVLKLC